jgi:hypothetical protein
MRIARLQLVRAAGFLVLLFLSSIPAAAQKASPTESQVKAAYLYNFGKFVRWEGDRPVNPDSLEICVLGKDPFGAVLDATVEGESIAGKKITVRRLSTVQESARCSILFVGTSEESRLAPFSLSRSARACSQSATYPISPSAAASLVSSCNKTEFALK